MKHVRISVLIPGMVTAEDVIGKGSQLVLPKGLVLTDKAIKRLEDHEIRSIRIEDPVDFDVEEIDDEEEEVSKAKANANSSNIDKSLLSDNNADDLLSALSGLLGEEEKPKADVNVEVHEVEEASHFEKIQSSPEFQEFKKGFEDNVNILESQLNDIVEKNAPIEVDTMLQSTMTLLSTQNSTFGVFDMLHNMRQFDDLTYAHSMNVALICNVLAEWLGLSKEEVKLATACGMFHDIGKLKIPDSIIKKPGKLTDEEFKIIKSHPIEGYRILQHNDVNEHIKNACLMHHEKCDGSGYPFKLTADRIDGYAKLVAIADVYDAMTSARVYRGALCPFTVIETFEDEGLHKYDIVFIMTFLENVVNTYIDNRVQLSDGSIGTIKWIDKQNLSRPMIQLLDGQFVELAKRRDLKIVKIL